MKHLKIAFGLAVLAGLMAVAAAPAMAMGPRWVTCEKVSSGKWKNSLCTEAGAGTWETKEITTTVEVTSSGKLELEDSEPKAGGKVVIECSGSNRGTVGAEGQDSIISITAESCEFVNKEHGACEEGAGIKRIAHAVNLPWSTRLEERKNGAGTTELRDLIVSLGKNPPGWNVECRVAGVIEIHDECTGRTSTAVRSNRANGSTEYIFDKISAEEPATCTEGKKAGTGFVRGTVFGRLRTSTGELRPLWTLSEIEKT
jgi:hypothetical protein